MYVNSLIFHQSFFFLPFSRLPLASLSKTSTEINTCHISLSHVQRSPSSVFPTHKISLKSGFWVDGEFQGSRRAHQSFIKPYILNALIYRLFWCDQSKEESTSSHLFHMVYVINFWDSVTRWGFTTVTKQEPEASTEIHDIDGSMVAGEVWGWFYLYGCLYWEKFTRRWLDRKSVV